jgi:hypothetical protein
LATLGSLADASNHAVPFGLSLSDFLSFSINSLSRCTLQSEELAHCFRSASKILFLGCPATRPVSWRASAAWVEQACISPLHSRLLDPTRMHSRLLALSHRPMAKLPHPFHLRVFDMQGLVLRRRYAIGAGY